MQRNTAIVHTWSALGQLLIWPGRLSRPGLRYSSEIPGASDQQVGARDIAGLFRQEIIQCPKDIVKTPRMPGRQALWWAADAVFEKARGDHVHRDAFGHEELRIAARQHVHAQFGDVVRGRHDMRFNAITGRVPEIDDAAWWRGRFQER